MVTIHASIVKRFKVTINARDQAILSRNNAPVAIPLRLDLDETDVGLHLSYSLTAVVHHHGTRLRDGHYTTDFLHPSSQHWYHADDGIVYPVAGPSAVPTSPYLLVFQRIDI